MWTESKMLRIRSKMQKQKSRAVQSARIGPRAASQRFQFCLSSLCLKIVASLRVPTPTTNQLPLPITPAPFSISLALSLSLRLVASSVASLSRSRPAVRFISLVLSLPCLFLRVSLSLGCSILSFLSPLAGIHPRERAHQRWRLVTVFREL